MPLLKVWQEWQESGFKGKHFDNKTFTAAWGNMAAHILSRVLAGLLLKKIIGERIDYGRDPVRGMAKPTADPYGIADTIFNYALMGPGFAIAQSMHKSASEVGSALFKRDAKSAAEAFERLGNDALYFAIVVENAKVFFEAVGDRQGMSNVDVIRSIIRRKIDGGTYVPRDYHMALTHIIFDTEPPNREGVVHKLWEYLKEKVERDKSWSPPLK